MNIFLVSPNNFPKEDAGALRDEAFARLFRSMGHRVTVLSRGRSAARGELDGIPYVSHFRPVSSRAQKLLHRLDAVSVFRGTFDAAVREFGKPDLLYAAYDDNRILRFLQRYAKKQGIPLLVDVCEWYSPCEFRLGRLSHVYLLNDLQNRFVLKAPTRIVAISRYLETHFRSRGLSTLRVPVIFDCAAIDGSVSREAGSPVQLIYAGSPGGKDSLRPLLTALLLLTDTERERLRLHIVGISEEQLLANGILCAEERTKLSDTLSVYGRVPHDTVEAMLKRMDFSVLLRPADERYAKAGFPTKVVEAMSHGTAMLCNLSSDLSDYLTDGENAILAGGQDEAAVRDALLRVTSLDDAALCALRNAARATAEQCFDYRGYAAAVAAFAGLSAATEADA